MKPFQGLRKFVLCEFSVCMLNGTAVAKLLKSELKYAGEILCELHKFDMGRMCFYMGRVMKKHLKF